MKRILLAATLLLVTAGGVWAIKPWRLISGGSVALVRIPTAEAREGAFERWVRSVGFLQASNSVTIYTPYSGKITKLIPEGTRVEVGDPVFYLDTVELEKQRDDTSATLGLSLKDLESAREEYHLTELKNQFDLDQAATTIQIAEQGLRDARQKHDAERLLVERNVSPRSRLEEAYLSMVQAELDLRNRRIDLLKAQENTQSNLRIAQTAIDRRQLEVENQRKMLKEAETKIEKAIVRSTVDGELSYLQYWKGGNMGKPQEGDSVWEGSNLFEIPDTRQMLVIVPVHESEISTIKPGQTAMIRVEAFPDVEVKGEVVTKSVVPSTTMNRRRAMSEDTGPREFDVRIKILENDPRFRHGMTASARILVTEFPMATNVPIEAVVRRNGKTGVVLSPERAFKEVEVLGMNDNEAALKQGAIPPGTSVFLRDPQEDLSEAVGTGKLPPGQSDSAGAG
jgi:HlyD family secretion protein